MRGIRRCQLGILFDGARLRLRQKQRWEQSRRSQRKRLDGRHIQTERTIYLRRLGFRVGGVIMLGGMVMLRSMVRRRMLADDICQDFRVAVKAQRRERGRYRAEQHRKQRDAREKAA